MELAGARVEIAGALLLRSGARWLLLARGPAVSVNGMPLVTRLHVLRHADEFTAAGAGHIFETGGAAAPAPFPGPEGARCARCHTAIAPGSPAVRCTCGLYYHQDESAGLTCFAYAADARCPGCNRPTLPGTSGLVDPED